MPYLASVRSDSGKEAREMAAQCFLEFKNTSYHDVLSMTESDILGLTQTKAWQNSDKNSFEQQRFEAIVNAINATANSLTKTISNGFTALIKTLAGR